MQLVFRTRIKSFHQASVLRNINCYTKQVAITLADADKLSITDTIGEIATHQIGKSCNLPSCSSEPLNTLRR